MDPWLNQGIPLSLVRSFVKAVVALLCLSMLFLLLRVKMMFIPVQDNKKLHKVNYT